MPCMLFMHLPSETVRSYSVRRYFRLLPIRMRFNLLPKRASEPEGRPIDLMRRGLHLCIYIILPDQLSVTCDVIMYYISAASYCSRRNTCILHVQTAYLTMTSTKNKPRHAPPNNHDAVSIFPRWRPLLKIARRIRAHNFLSLFRHPRVIFLGECSIHSTTPPFHVFPPSAQPRRLCAPRANRQPPTRSELSPQ